MKKEIALKTLRAGSGIVLVTGLLPVFAIFEWGQEPWRLFFDLLAWPLDLNPGGFTDTERQLSAVLGGVLCGWAWMMYRLANPKVFNPAIRKLMIQSVWVWFIVDSGGSIIAGIPLNAVSNLIFFAVLMVPLLKLRSAS